MRRLFIAVAALCAVFAGTWTGTLATRWIVANAASRNAMVRNGWSGTATTLPSDKYMLAAVKRADRASRNPAAFPDEVIAVFVAQVDSDGRALSGASRYVLRFPTAETLWFLSALGGENATQADMPSLSSRSADLRRNADGSLEILIQADPPDDPSANWLPTPPGAFKLAMHVYALADRASLWQPPTIQRRESAA